MGFLGVVLVVVFIATSILLVGVVLLQDEQGEGLGGIFGGGSSTPFGSRSGNVLTRFTTILGAIFLFCAFGIAWVNRTTQSGDVLAAAKKEQATQSTEWWNASVSSNQTLSGNGSSSGTSTASGSSGSTAPAATSGAAATSSAPAATSTPAASSAKPAAGQQGSSTPSSTGN